MGTMLGFLLVLKAEVVRSIIIMRRYWFAALTGIIVGYGMLILLIVAFATGNQQVLDPLRERFADKAMSGVLGFVTGIFAFGTVGMFSQGLSSMARSGELEQLCMSPHGLVGNFLARSVVAAVSNIVSATILVALVSATIKGTLHFSAIPLAVLLALTFTNLLGFGFMVGGLVLVFKQTGQVAMIIRMVLLALPIAASDRMYEWPMLAQVLAHIMPVTDAALCLKLVLLQGKGMGIFLTQPFYLLMVNCAVWTALGIFCFRYMENWSRDKGTLGAY